ncbi:hypothetical protein CKO42_26200 [Lamprobacter modestohalophilus]|uniref:NrS-1 polymerase-like helicase domain-containing protein n=1 Tax=Lamprobacter modestohalophilus TaxID=1064514 RepID=A0A9X1B6S3_9GAMM|nr:primase-helicase family protein [Lamprobacter modestohalophilus]MBK1621808.1 hypothetical protein [Lamprobacter modestohalophilus]
MHWLAYSVQHPERQAEVAVVLKSEARGTGKGTFGRLVCQLFGNHARHITHSRHLTGNFNAHLRDCCLLFADEAFFVGDRAGSEVLKGLITEPTLIIERKGVDAIQAPNRLKIIMATNADWVIPAGADERRYLVLEVSTEHRQDHAYFSELNRLIDGGAGALLHYLLSLDLSGFNIRKVPTTRSLTEQKTHSFDAFNRWLHNALCDGEWKANGLRLEWDGPHSKGRIKECYDLFVKEHGIRYAQMDPSAFWRRMNKTLPGSLHSRPMVDGRRQQSVGFPPLPEARGQFEAAALNGDANDWPDDGTGEI